MITRKIKIGKFFDSCFRSFQNIAHHLQSLFDRGHFWGGGVCTLYPSMCTPVPLPPFPPVTGLIRTPICNGYGLSRSVQHVEGRSFINCAFSIHRAANVDTYIYYMNKVYIYMDTNLIHICISMLLKKYMHTYYYIYIAYDMYGRINMYIIYGIMYVCIRFGIFLFILGYSQLRICRPHTPSPPHPPNRCGHIYM